jgi:glyoxylase-like metal-dependent hydrolase (beta-lactamase superfamily II)
MKAIRILALCLATVIPAVAHAQQPQRQEGELAVTAIRGGVHFLVMEPAGNVAVSAGPEGAIVIDDQFEPMVPRIKAAVAKLTDKPIRYIINTHWHGDHSGGNAEFEREGYVIVAQDNVRTRMSKDQFSKFRNRTTPASPPEALPVITFSDNATFWFNGDEIRITHVPHAHTDGDALLYFAKADVLHTGDTFVRYGYPFIDLSTGGSVAGMIAACDRTLAIAGEKTVIVPGHGKLGTRADVKEFRDMLATARGRVASQLQLGKGVEDIVAAKPLADLDARWGQGFIKAEQFVRVIVESEKES